jgi:hypothetical protein
VRAEPLRDEYLAPRVELLEFAAIPRAGRVHAGVGAVLRA